MIDHVILNVRDFEASKRFYDKALAPLGCGVMMELPKGVGAFVLDRDGNNLEAVCHRPE